MSLRKIIYAFAAFFTMGCNGNLPSEAPAAGFDASEDCFNGRLIFSLGEKFGIADSADSTILIQADYEQISFISDEMALAKVDGKWDLLDKDGHLVASSIDSSFLVSESAVLKEFFVEKEAEAWDRILDIYEKMSEKPGRKLLEELRRMISEASLGMNEEQSERFSRIRTDHFSR